MYLINIRKLTLEYFVGDYKIPPYFILSHTWSDDEITYQDVQNLPPEALEYRQGWIKIKGLCNMLLQSKDWLASDTGFYSTINYVWVDTCCINKESSAELSEAINSMYQWYQKAAACIVYLADVTNVVMDSPEMHSSRWFTRGWTLQELLAPHYVVFCNSFWIHLGSRALNSQLLSTITGIHSKFLDHSSGIEDASIAEKMSWAAFRKTTRSEDTAYCLMGLFDINMPLLYGEGGIKAFIRLQEEILKDSTDESLFAWDASFVGEDGMGMLATHPSRFHSGASIVPLRTRKNPQAVKNGGILMNVPVISSEDSTSGASVVILDCATEDDPNPDNRVMIEVMRKPECSRVPKPCFIAPKPDVADEALFFLKRSVRTLASPMLHRCEVFWEGDTFTLLEAWPGTCWSLARADCDDWGRGVLEASLSRRQFTLNLRRALQLTQEAGLDNDCSATLAVLALCPENHPGEAFVLGISLESLNGKWTISMRNMRGQAFPTRPEDFQYSHHWSCVSALIDAWGTGKEVFGSFETAAVETTSFTVNAVGVPALIDRRKGVEVHVFAHPKGNLSGETLPRRMVPSEPMKSIPPKEYWQPYYKEPEARKLTNEPREETRVERITRIRRELDRNKKRLASLESGGITNQLSGQRQQ